MRFFALFLAACMLMSFHVSAQHDDSVSTYLKALYAAENFDEIIAHAGEYEFQSLNSTSCYYIGLAHFMKQQDSLSLIYFKRSITLNPFFPEVYYYSGLSLTYMEAYDEAITYFGAGLKIVPDEADYHEALAEAYYFNQQPDSAMTHLETAASLNAGRGDLYLKMADIYMDYSLPDKALEVYYQCLYKADPDDEKYFDCLYNIGYLEYQNGNYDDAELALTTLLSSRPDDYQAIEKLIQVYFATKKGMLVQKLRTKLYGAHWKNELPPYMKDAFCFDQFDWNEYRVMAYEHFAEPKEQLYYKHIFHVFDKDENEIYTIQTERNAAVVASGKAYYIGKTDQHNHYIYFDSQLASNFTYSTLKSMVTSIMDDKLEPTEIQEIKTE